METCYLPNGLTVKKLKEILQDWPEIDSEGNETTVWMETEWDNPVLVFGVSSLSIGNVQGNLLLSKDI